MIGTAQPIASQVVFAERAADGRGKHGRVFLPLAPSFLAASQPPPADVYRLASAGRLELFLRKDTSVPPDVRNQAARGEMRQYCYVKEGDGEVLLHHGDRVLPEILEDRRVQLGARCRALHNLTTLLAWDVFERPLALNIFRLGEHASRVVEFLLREYPVASRILLRMSHADYSNAAHAANVGFHALATAVVVFGRGQAAGLREMAEGLFLHDIGKCLVPAAILNKTGPLLDSEWYEVKKHPGYGYTLLTRERLLSDTARQVVQEHHERADGQGYPVAMAGGSIHPYARMCAIADAFDALTTRRTFRPALRPFDALRIMREEMRTQFDPEMFRAFVLLMKR